MYFIIFFFFFFQAEDGIRDTSVTGVQTCALPIFSRESGVHFLEKAKTLSNHRLQGREREATSGRSRTRQRCGAREDRKSTRLNSSHRCISYAVFCLKKKKKIEKHTNPEYKQNI